MSGFWYAADMMRRIFAMGGGGFQMEPENLRLDHFAFSLTNRERPRVCLIPTASGDSRDLIGAWDLLTQKLPCEPSVLSLFRGTHGDLRAHVLAQDLVYVTGGNTRNMLCLWREWGLVEALRDAYDRGVVMAGLSAGSICWFEHGITDSIPGALTPIRGLGWLSGSHAPHYDGEALRRPCFQRFIAEGTIPDGIAADDGVGLVYENESLVRLVKSRPTCAGYRVGRDSTGFYEERIEAALLPVL